MSAGHSEKGNAKEVIHGFYAARLQWRVANLWIWAPGNSKAVQAGSALWRNP